jgi:hypothetical protein
MSICQMMLGQKMLKVVNVVYLYAENRLERILQNAQAFSQPIFYGAICVRKYLNILNDVRTKMLKVINVEYLYAEK